MTDPSMVRGSSGTPPLPHPPAAVVPRGGPWQAAWLVSLDPEARLTLQESLSEPPLAGIVRPRDLSEIPPAESLTALLADLETLRWWVARHFRSSGTPTSLDLSAADDALRLARHLLLRHQASFPLAPRT